MLTLFQSKNLTWHSADFRTVSYENFEDIEPEPNGHSGTESLK